MEQVLSELSINGQQYVLKSNQEPAEPLNKMPYVLVRTYSAGVFLGYLESRIGKEGKLLQARRIWYWSGAASLSQLAIEGTNRPKECKFAVPVSIELTEIIEVIQVTQQAKTNLDKVETWKV